MSRIFESYSFDPNELRQISRQIAMVQVEEGLRVKEIGLTDASVVVSYISSKNPAPERLIYKTIQDLI